MDQTNAITSQTPRRKHRITTGDVEQIASLIVDRFNEKEACAIVGVNYDTWLKWKVRAKNDSRFEKVLTYARACYIQGRLDNIKRHETKDWRASDRLLQIAAPERFSPNAKVEFQATASPLADALLVEAIKRVYGEHALSKAKEPLKISDAN